MGDIFCRQEVKESLFKRETIKTALRVDCVYAMESRLRTHLLWFDTFLNRTTMVSEADKERTYEAMNDVESLLDSGRFVRQRVAKGRAEGLAEGLQEALAITLEFYFPTLLDLVQRKAEHVKQPEVLRFVIRAIKTAPNEEAARALLETLGT